MAGRTMRAIIVGVTTALLIAVAAPPTAAGSKDKSQVFAITEAGPEPVPGAWSMLERDGDAVQVKMRTRLDPGHVDTLWAVIFNNPAGCTGPCGPDDIFLDPADHSAGFNVAGIQAAQITATWAGGAIANAAGRWKLDATIVEGVLPTGPGQQLLGAAESAIFSLSSVDGLVNAAGAEIHFILQDHGPAHADPALRAQQLSMFLGACNPEPADLSTGNPGSCAEVQFSAHA